MLLFALTFFACTACPSIRGRCTACGAPFLCVLMTPRALACSVRCKAPPAINSHSCPARELSANPLCAAGASFPLPMDGRHMQHAPLPHLPARFSQPVLPGKTTTPFEPKSFRPAPPQQMPFCAFPYISQHEFLCATLRHRLQCVTHNCDV